MSQPVNLNLEEIRVVNMIYARQMRLLAWGQRRMHQRQVSTRRGFAYRRQNFYTALVGLTYIFSLACSTVQAAPPAPVPPAPFVCASRPIRGLVVQSADASGNPVEGPVMVLETPICACSDKVVRTCE